jgi:hypothetical protein
MLSTFWNCTALRAILASADHLQKLRYQGFVAEKQKHRANQESILLN